MDGILTFKLMQEIPKLNLGNTGKGVSYLI